MKTSTFTISKQWGLLLLLLVIAAIVTACGGEAAAPEPTVAPTVAPTATTAPTPTEEATEEAEGAAAPESPLLQPESPLIPSAFAPKTEEEAIALAAQTKAPAPSEGHGTVSGLVYSFGNLQGGLPDIVAYLEVADEIDGKFFPASVSTGPQLARGDVAVQTNEFGQVQFEATPGNYYLAVWTLYSWRLAVPAPGEESPLLITIEEGDQLDLGVLYVDWP